MWMKFGRLIAPLLIAIQFLSATTAHAGRLEAGEIRTIPTTGTGSQRIPTPVTFQNPFDTVPIVVAISDQAGSNSASIRIFNVTTTGFDALMLEPDNWDGRHIAQDVQYIAVEPGRHVLPGGGIIEAAHETISNVQHGSGVAGPTSWANINYTAPLGASVALLSQIQTANSEIGNPPNTASRPHITAIVQNAGSTGFQLALERSQALTGPIPSAEIVGWIAMTAGGNENFPDINGNTINWASRVTGFAVRGWDNGCFAQNFGLSSSTAVVVAKKTSRRNGDGGWFRYCSLGSTTIGLRVEEDTDQDGERSVASGDAEQASIIAFSRPFHANLRANISLTKVSQNFVSTVDANHFSLPGASFDYLILATNIGNAPPNHNSLVITETLPANIEMRVSDFGAPGSGPLEFSQGSPTSGLAYIFTALNNGADSISFSTDGVNFNHDPTPDIDGFDSAITHFRIQPSGFFAADRGGGSPNFSIRFKARIK